MGRRPPDRWCGGDGGKNGGADGSTGPAGAHHRIPERVRGAWLDGLVRRSMEREWSGGTERRVVTVEQYGGAVGAPAEAEALDRLFRRDARRYDGGFRLL